MANNNRQKAAARSSSRIKDLKAEVEYYQTKAYQMWHLAHIRRGRVVSLLAEMKLTRYAMYTAVALDVVLASIVIFALFCA